MDPSGLDPATFSGKVPLFPLDNVVLFPHAFLPLHIFEPRYRAMTARALEGEGLIAMARFLPGWERDYDGNPPIRDVVGVGRILQHERRPDGRYDLMLFGVARARVVDLVSSEPYRTARVELLPDRPESGERYGRLRRLLLEFYRELLRKALGGAAPPPGDLSLGALCDHLAALLGFDPPVKQTLLEEVDVGARCDRLVTLLQASNAPGLPWGKPPWPPGSSLN